MSSFAMGDPGGSEQPPNTIDACTSDSECVTRLEGVVEEFRSPPVRPPVTLVEASCEHSECPRDLYCKCVYMTQADGGASAEALTFGLDEHCDAVGRTGECLLPASATPVCDPGDACSCAASCERALSAIAADAERQVDAEARSARCVNQAYPPEDAEPGDSPSAGPRDAGSAVPISGRCNVSVGVCSNCYEDAVALDCSSNDGG